MTNNLGNIYQKWRREELSESWNLTSTNGDIFENWTRYIDGNESSKIIKYKDGSIFKNWTIDTNSTIRADSFSLPYIYPEYSRYLKSVDTSPNQTFINLEFIKNGPRKAEILKLSNGAVFKNWSFDPISQLKKSDSLELPSNEVYENWSIDELECVKCSIYKSMSGEVYHNYCEDINMNRKSDLVTDKLGSQYQNWEYIKSTKTSKSDLLTTRR